MTLSRQRLWQLKQVERGRCEQCGKPNRGPYQSLCIECYPKERAAQRRRLGHKKWEPGGRGRRPYLTKPDETVRR